MERVNDEQNGLQAKLQLGQRDQKMRVDAIDRVNSDVEELQKYVSKDTFASQKRIEDHSVWMCRRFGCLFAERVMKARKEQSQIAGEWVGSYAERRKNRLKRFKQLVQDSSRVGDVQIEKPETCFVSADRKNKAPNNPDDIGNDVDAGPSSV